MQTPFGKLWVGIAALAFSSGLLTAQSLTGLKAVRVPVFDQKTSHQVAVLRFEQVVAESRSIGIFKVRLLPKMVARDFHLQLLSPRCEADVFEVFNNWFKSQSLRGKWEVNRFKISFGKEEAVALQAESLRPVSRSSGSSFLLDGITLSGGEKSLRIPRGTLQFVIGQPPVLFWTENGINKQTSLEPFPSSFKSNSTDQKNEKIPPHSGS